MTLHLKESRPRKYVIIARDKTINGYPKRIWIYDDKTRAMNNFEVICSNEDWFMPEFIEIDEIYYNGEYL